MATITSALHVHHASASTFPWHPLFYGGREHTRMNSPFIFLTWIKFSGIQLQEKSPTFDKQGGLEFDRTKFSFFVFTDVFTPLVAVVAWTPYFISTPDTVYLFNFQEVY